jgi:hypothetical protein
MCTHNCARLQNNLTPQINAEAWQYLFWGARIHDTLLQLVQPCLPLLLLPHNTPQSRGFFQLPI